VSTNTAELEAEEKEVEIIDEQEQEQEQEQVEASQESTAEDKPEDSGDKEQELEQYSKSVQQRINKLTQKYREEEAQRVAAIEFAESVKKQNDELKARLDTLDKSYVGEFGSRIESQIESAKQAYQKAYDDGDAEAMFEAQKNLSRLALDQTRLEEQKQRREAEDARLASTPAPQAEAQASARAPARAAPDPKAESWAAKNEWFGTDQTMTYAAFGIHRQLIEDEGFDPASDDYYNELDTRIRRDFPHKFAGSKRGDTGPRVASAESSASKAPSKKGRRTVKLTPSQIAIAKRLNVPLEEYAKYVKE
jgi:hypothetical protein